MRQLRAKLAMFRFCHALINPKFLLSYKRLLSSLFNKIFTLPSICIYQRESGGGEGVNTSDCPLRSPQTSGD
jgi:hypothetical protein